VNKAGGHFAHDMPFGAALLPDGGAKFRLWAPGQTTLRLLLEEDALAPVTMQRDADGWFQAVVREAEAGMHYRFLLEDGMRIPDPASRFQPQDVHGPSRIIDPRAYRWQHADWRGRPWEEAVVYESHVGCFSPTGDFDGARRKLDHLAGLGVTAFELMPVGDFEGRRNWGYDGVLPFAPDASYGAPEELKRLMDEAHGRGLMVFLDVVYNHFGPSGNYLHLYAPTFFTGRHRTQWGAGLNFDGPQNRTVRDFFIHNALYWIEEYRIDGLRLDAVHAIADDSAPGFLEDLAAAVHACVGAARHVHLVLENDHNEAAWLARRERGRPRAYTAQWNDDFHHAAHVAATGEAQGYYRDYADDPLGRLGRALSEGFIYQGEASRHRDGAARGTPSAHLPPTAFVDFLQNHDQIGNRARGERLRALAVDAAVDALGVLLLLSPQVPLLFMGEEWGTHRPFRFFCDFHGELAAAVREGRRREFSHFPEFHDPASWSRVPDPNALTTFEDSRLDWGELHEEPYRGRLDRFRALLALRHREIVPRLSGIGGGSGAYETAAGQALRVTWRLDDGSRLQVAANLADQPVADLAWAAHGRCLYAHPEDHPVGTRIAALRPWSVLWHLLPPTAK
jgi:maltooligosyltrehalose trehalohydrolase